MAELQTVAFLDAIHAGTPQGAQSENSLLSLHVSSLIIAHHYSELLLSSCV
jgi:hypothetical protein